MTRVRDNSRVVDYTSNHSWGNRSQGKQSDIPPVVISVVHPDVMQDVVNPDFKKRSANGEIFNSPMTYWKGERILHPVQKYNWWAFHPEDSAWDQWVTITGEYRCSHSFEILEDARVVDEIARLEGLAITGAYANVGSPDVALLTELAELKETLAFLWSPVKGMVNLTKRFSTYINRVEHILKKDAARLKKWEDLPPHIREKRKEPVATILPKFKVGKFEATDISSAWLAYRYGLMPLIYTFEDVQELLKKRLEGSPIRATARAKETGYVKLASDIVSENYWDGNFYEMTHRVDGSCKVEVRAGVLYEVDASLQTQLGLRMNRVPMALYEAIPLSFVTDWFHNGADFYDALTAECRAQKILTAWTSTTVNYNVVFHEVFGPVTQGTGIVTGSFSETRHGKWKRRKPATLADVQLSFRVSLNSKRVADGLALIHTFLSTGKMKK